MNTFSAVLKSSTASLSSPEEQVDDSMPNLIESTSKLFLNHALKESHEYKIKTYNLFFNLALGIGFFVIGGIILYMRWKTQPTPYEKKLKMMRDREIILHKIRNFQDDRRRAQYSDITKLPFVDNDHFISNSR
jgi:hypothetical protein